jgi:hypothetical protein
LAGCAADTSGDASNEPQADTTNEEAELTASRCRLAVEDPKIRYIAAGALVAETLPNSNPVGEPVLNLLRERGFALTSSGASFLRMQTEVRCGPMLTFWGYVNGCQTEVSFVKRRTGEVIHVSRTIAKPGMSIDFDGITFPRCADLR